MDKERRVAIKLAYDGTKFHGFQRQPDRPTVEGTLVDAMRRVGVIDSPRNCGYKSASRTDSGVSALGNIVSFRTSFPTRSLCSAVNSEMEDAWAYSVVEVADGFNPRAARQRWYRYHLPKRGQDRKVMKAVAERFVGVHDFSGYAKVDRRNPMRKVDAIDISDAGAFHALDFRAESFLWNMVRRIAWMIDESSSGRILERQVGPEAKERPRRVGLAPSEYLVLMDVDCGVLFPVDQKIALGIRREMERRMNANAMRMVFSQLLMESIAPRDVS